MMHCDFVIYQPIRIVVSFNYMLLIICVYHYTTLVQSICGGFNLSGPNLSNWRFNLFLAVGAVNEQIHGPH
jgi:hypothetical protein